MNLRPLTLFMFTIVAACGGTTYYTGPETGAVVPHGPTVESTGDSKGTIGAGGDTTVAGVKNDEPIRREVPEGVPIEPIAEVPADATCEQAATRVLDALGRDDLVAAELAVECERNQWTAELRKCFAELENADGYAACADLYDRHVAAAILRANHITLTATAEAELCYAGGEGADAHCRSACDDGFAEACRVAGDLARSCDLAWAIRDLPTAHSPISDGARRVEVMGGAQACTAVAQPLFDHIAVTGNVADDQADLVPFAIDACQLGVYLGAADTGEVCRLTGYAAMVVGDWDNSWWALETACDVGDGEACDVLALSAGAVGGSVDIGDDWFWPGL